MMRSKFESLLTAILTGRFISDFEVPNKTQPALAVSADTGLID